MERTTILPNKWNALGFLDIPKYKELLMMFMWRDIKVRYKQTLLGVAWVVFQPLMMMIILTLFFGMLIKVPSYGLPYSVFFLSTYIVWVLFSEGITRSYMGITSNVAIIAKVYFPRIIIPLSGVITPIVDFSIAFLILIAIMLFYGLTIPVTILFVPIIVLWSISISFGVGAFLSALNVRYRDIQYAVPFMLMLWMYTSPIVYPSTLIPTQYHIIYYLNPTTWIMDFMRYSLFGTPLSPLSVIPAIIITFFIFVVGLLFFEHQENKFVDFI